VRKVFLEQRIIHILFFDIVFIQQLQFDQL
jgi:hypothetical protein